MRLSFPSDYGTKGCALVAIDMTLLPIVAGKLRELEEERSWEQQDYQQAYRAIADLESCMTSLCVQDLVESNDRLYRLIDAGIFGRVYTAGAEPPGTITPVIPAVPDLSFADPGALSKMERVSQLLQSRLNGDDTPNYSGTPNIPALLQAIIDALNADDTNLEGILAALEQVVILLG